MLTRISSVSFFDGCVNKLITFLSHIIHKCMGDWELGYIMLYKQSDSLLLVLWTLMSFLILDHKARCYTT